MGCRPPLPLCVCGCARGGQRATLAAVLSAVHLFLGHGFWLTWVLLSSTGCLARDPRDPAVFVPQGWDHKCMPPFSASEHEFEGSNMGPHAHMASTPEPCSITLAILALEMLRQDDHCGVWGQPGLYSKFQANPGLQSKLLFQKTK